MKSRRSPRYRASHLVVPGAALGPAFLCFMALFWLGTPSPGAAPARPDPMRDASRPERPTEDPSEERVPGSGTRRVGIPTPRPITMPGTSIDRSSTDPRRPTMTQLSAGDPQRRQARDLALATFQGEGGPERVARMVAADVGARSEEAARVLAEGAGLPALRRLARHPDPQVRTGTARALAHRPSAAQTLLGALLADKSIKVVLATVQTVALIGSAPLLGRLAAATLRYDRSIRASALVVLAQHGELPAAKSAVIAAVSHPSPLVRLDAVSAIGLARAAWARESLERLAVDPSADLRRCVAKALGRLPPEPSALRLLGRLAKDRAPEVRDEAKRARAELQAAQRAARKPRRPRGTR